MNYRILLFTLLITLTVFVSYKATHAFFTSNQIIAGNTITTALISPTPTTTPTPTVTTIPSPTPTPTGIADHIVLSEVQIDAGNGQEANDSDFIELYNPTSSPISLNGYRLVKRTGGSGSDDNIFEFTSSHIVPTHGYFLWAHQSGGQNPNNYATTIGADVFSADTLGASNSIAIRQGNLDTGTLIDALSWDPGASSLKEGTQFPSNPQENQSMERKALSTSTTSSMGTGGTDETKGNGFDSNDNSVDFILREVSQPQNSSDTAEIL